MDGDGDGNKWILFDVQIPGYPPAAYSGVNVAASYSWFNGNTLTPTNYLITPQITIQNNSELFWAVSAQSPTYSNEHYRVYVSTAGNQIADFTALIFEETLPQNDNTWKTRTYDLTEYIGSPIYIAFAHTQSTNIFAIKLDDITVTEKLNFVRYELYRDEELIFQTEDFDLTSFDDYPYQRGTFEYQLKAIYEGGFVVSTPTISLEVDDTGTSVQTLLFAVDAFPNPFKNELSIVSDKGIEKIKISSVNGREIFSHTYKEVKNVKINTADFDYGVYILIIENTNGRRVVKKIIK